MVITRADIELIQPKSVLDVLGTVAGFDVTVQGGRGQNASIFIRGANSNQTLVLVDGIRVSSASLGATSLQTIAPEMIERIEIVKGPRAAIWGSDAIGGVINILTRKLEGGEFVAGATYGTDNYQQLKAGLGFSHGDGATSVVINKEKSDGFDVLEGADNDDDGYDYTSIAIRGQQKVTGQFNLDWMLNADDGDTEYDNASFGGNDERDVTHHAWLVRGQYKAQIGHVANTTSVSVGQNRDLSKDGGTDFPTRFETRRDQFSLLNHSQVFPHFQVSLGADLYKEELSSTTVYQNDERDVKALFAHTLYSLNNVTFEAAIRYDDVESIDSETSYNAGAGYQLSEDTRIALNVGTGFKAPTFNDLYFPASPYSSGIPDLTSETSETVELVLETSAAGVDFGFSVFQTDVEDLIAWMPDENFFYKPENVNEVEIKGAELTAYYIGLGGTHQVNASYTDTEDKATGKQLIRRAKEKFVYQFDTKIGELGLYLEYQFNGERDDTSFATGDLELDSYHLVNLAASYSLTPQLKLETRITNAFDEDYNTSIGYNTQERAGYIGINYSM